MCAILINAGVTHPHSPSLDRLAYGGRLILPLTVAYPAAAFFGQGVELFADEVASPRTFSVMPRSIPVPAFVIPN
jgi:hypothetical protein